MDSLRDSYHKSIEFIHQINHPYITRMVGMITQTGSIILEKAAIGSLDKYLQVKVSDFWPLWRHFQLSYLWRHLSNILDFAFMTRHDFIYLIYSTFVFMTSFWLVFMSFPSFLRPKKLKCIQVNDSKLNDLEESLGKKLKIFINFRLLKEPILIVCFRWINSNTDWVVGFFWNYLWSDCSKREYSLFCAHRYL